jgi:hypothetical protein
MPQITSYLINKSLPLGLLTLLTLLTLCSTLIGRPLQLASDSSNQVTVTQTDHGVIELRTTGDDPYIIFSAPPATQVDEDASILAFEYFCPDGVDFIEVFYSRDLNKKDWSGRRQLEGGALPKAEAWQPHAIDLKNGTKGKWKPADRALRIDIGRKSGTQIRLRNLHLRAPTTAEQMNAAEGEAIRARKFATAATIEAYIHKDNWPTRRPEVSACGAHIYLKGTLENPSAGQVVLVEYQPHEDPWNPGAGTVVDHDGQGFDYNITLPRFEEDGRDRIAHRYAFAQQLHSGKKRVLISPASWVTDLSCSAERDMPRLVPANKKGLGGITYKKGIYEADLVDLGITASTINIELSSIVNVGPNAKKIEYSHQGKVFQFNAGRVQQLDKDIRQLTEMNIVTSAVILVGKNAGNLVHPDFNPAGVYAMANLTTQDSSDHYRAVISFLAERYSRPDKEHGWITHWIVFNEVDVGWVWTNMGETPMAVYMNAYEKAMRLTYIEARRFNPTAEVFISLTHHWNYSYADQLKAYPPRDLLDRMADYSALSGDYQWAIAYHPYPQSLFQSRAWEDNKAINDFDTDYITPKNIEVLAAYLHQPQFLYKDKERTVILSEQGYHTPDYSEQSMIDKAAAIAYTWAKIMPLDSIESFHYHRWVDHPQEGGLKLGLRTLPSDEHPHGIRKEPAFSVFSAMETEDAETASEPYKKVIGIEAWPEIRIAAEDISTKTTE